MFAYDNGGHFSCHEADSVAALLMVAGHGDAAITWLEGHAEADSEGSDIHIEFDDDDVFKAVDIPAYVDSLLS
ncbi:hypothetical protein SAMN05216276_1008167 [Streptosporangium subroseum]|uniref:Uncharacterized protein n=1 Tax=Streptosporangium subroseum TaxID=106412 RepID=A0A239E0V2_9ACTN|nr:hypothetical protein [Streptosporangium subroseum]SNS38237.1 hypothetical protein SAMN05216276_1008167 [Streptosporangium subroseum]